MNLTFPSPTVKNKYSFKWRTCHLIIALLLFSSYSFAQVGINTTTPSTTLDVNGALSLRESPRPIRVGNGVNENIELEEESPYSQYRIVGPTTAFSIDGITTVENADGQIIRLINTTDQVMTIVNNSSGDELKIVCPSERDLIVGGKNSSVTLQYSQGLRKWTVFGYASKNMRETVYGTTDIARQNSSWAPLDGLDITFTPVNTIIYISFNAYGSITGGNADFRLVNGSTEVPNSRIRGNVSGAFYEGSLPMFPIKVTPGVQITISAQWYRDDGASQIIRNNPATNPNHGRYLTIID